MLNPLLSKLKPGPVSSETKVCVPSPLWAVRIALTHSDRFRQIFWSLFWNRRPGVFLVQCFLIIILVPWSLNPSCSLSPLSIISFLQFALCGSSLFLHRVLVGQGEGLVQQSHTVDKHSLANSEIENLNESHVGTKGLECLGANMDDSDQTL